MNAHRLILFILFLNSCATSKPKIVAKKHQKTVSVDTALQLARTGFVRSCIQANKKHAPKEKWSKHCNNEANLYMKEIFEFLD